MFRVICGSLLLLALTEPVGAEVVKLEITERAAFADGHHFGNVGPYQRVKGWLTIAVDPGHALHRRITDLELAPTNKQGRVEFRTEFFLLKPLDPRRGNGRILYDVNNRGLQWPGRQPERPEDTGGCRQRVPDAAGLLGAVVRLER